MHCTQGLHIRKIDNHWFRQFFQNVYFLGFFVLENSSLSRPFSFQNLPFPMGPEATWSRTKSRKTQAKGVRMSGSKWVPGIRRPSPGRLISFRLLSPAFSVDTSGLCFFMLPQGRGCEVSGSFLPSAFACFFQLFFPKTLLLGPCASVLLWALLSLPIDSRKPTDLCVLVKETHVSD